jgi:diguanylate cyclase (GGDEF)-like protein/PAS domain S-box-containing protein
MINDEFLKTNEDLLESFLQSTSDLIFIFKVDGNDTKIVFANDTAKNKLGYSLDEMNEIGLEGFRKPLVKEDTAPHHIQKLKESVELMSYVNLVRKDKTEFPVEINTRIVEINGDEYKVSIVRDITNRQLYESHLKEMINSKTKELNDTIQQLKSYKEAMDVNSIVTISDVKGKIKYANDKFYEVTGFTKGEVIGKQHNIVRHPDEPKELFEDMWNTILAGYIWRGKLKNLTKDGKTYIVQSAIVPVMDEKGKIKEFIATRYEITDIINKQEKIEKLLITDTLTGLYNRFHLNEVINSAEDSASIAMIDINGFHEINDFYGDEVGDQIIMKLSNILSKRLQEKYLLFHLSGDEFIVFNKDVKKDLFISEMIEVNNMLNSKKLMINEKTFYLNTTVVLSFEDKEDLVPSVHLAKTFAKQNGLNFNIYTDDNPLEQEYKDNLLWSNKIKKAIQDDRITVFFQPIVDTNTKEIIKYESLVRMIGTDGEVISPYFFLDRAKKSNQYHMITKIVIDKTIDAMNEYGIDCSINLTIEDIQNDETKLHICEKLDNFDRCEDIAFELVESEGIENFDEVNRFIGHIKSHGCKVAIDDFGTGYSNFEYLLKLNADVIKIDGSLIKEIDKNQDHYDIVTTIVSFAKIKNLKVVAEFVSSEAIFEKIKELGIDFSQGYLFSEPKPME